MEFLSRGLECSICKSRHAEYTLRDKSGSCAVQNFVLYKHWESMRTHKNNNEAHHSNRECAFYLKGKE
jgi:hypothetical protein